ncbi:MAG: hypothetical protein UU77_C0010G0002 [candidate division WWE3 bacterium GW2011_GWC1_41_7]|uniref:Uncharacterized protein n=4 Tax=Katanobacteria TaxID=422282 RepID=A0A0G0ZI71_UNCKA|nr:MAG: hypothetical protein UU72_C0029G0003 [candidate division WWE3 bacterium GW2011_GWB1_41_6]KKS20978.1 MAG: hypothetical protein UU77_C0010G0002 [candidate division WWE3 bacterium GW2011_GWC1_41_7]KKS21731.1 MAG: hypothetical protein UU80_C0021G0002 [candidate division WWE3 bacterium GW2011_GWA1_41_8]OGC56515.1 MAG: hypothetical protein A2976_02905 [candidate division WWE3 bacterium RIFCSPLOWO2_01_FULL_41_9]
MKQYNLSLEFPTGNPYGGIVLKVYLDEGFKVFAGDDRGNSLNLLIQGNSDPQKIAHIRRSQKHPGHVEILPLGHTTVRKFGESRPSDQYTDVAPKNRLRISNRAGGVVIGVEI